MSAVPSKKASPAQMEAQKIKGKIDGMISNMQKNSHFTPTRDQLEAPAEELIDLINKFHSKTAPFEKYLKAAIIDLTEVPEMSPQMQRISFLTSLKDASKNLAEFINCY